MATLAPADATVSLFFTNIADRAPLRIQYFAVEDLSRPHHAARAVSRVVPRLVSARAVIFNRGLFEFGSMVSTAGWLGIPRYYFVDDNFMILKDEPGVYDPRLGSKYSRDRVRQVLSGFEGVLLATPSLVEYFREHQLHPRLELYPPVSRVPPPPARCRDRARVHIAFFGGMHRREPFLQHVLPAIARFSEQHPVTLFAAGIDLSGAVVPATVSVVPVPYNPAYPDALQAMAANAIDVLVHPSNVTANNIYKNPHFLINARALGATPIFSNAAPYAELSGDDLLVLSENTVGDWYSALARVATDDQLRIRLQANLAAYIERHFNGDANVAIINRIAAAHSRPGAAMAAARAVPAAASLTASVFADIGRRYLRRLRR